MPTSATPTRGGDRQLVEIDTNYKETRSSEYPVRLARTDAVQLATHLLAATEDTFHNTRCGRLRGDQTAELLRALGDVDHVLKELRDHALDDLLDDAEPDPDGAGSGG